MPPEPGRGTQVFLLSLAADRPGINQVIGLEASLSLRAVIAALRRQPLRDRLPEAANSEGLLSLYLGQLDPHLHAAEAALVLSEAECTRARRLANPIDQETFVFAHALLRTALAMRLGAAPGDLGFESGPFGKPALQAKHAHLHFSLSYRRGLVALALAERAVGVDVEWVRADLDVAGMARRFFSAAEWAPLLALPSPREQRAQFFEIWTRKEALAKAAGVGVDAVFSTDIRGPEVQTVNAAGGLHNYRLASMPVDAGWALALAQALD